MLDLYAILEAISGVPSVVGAGLVVAGAGTLVVTQRPFAFKVPHATVLAVAIAAAVMHAIECFGQGKLDAGVAFFMWGMSPYLLCLLIASFGTLRLAPVVGGALALAVDLLVHHAVFVAPETSTDAMLLIFVPFWNALVIVPMGTIVAWLLLRRRSRSAWLQP